MRIVQIGPYPLSNDCIRGGVEASVYGLAKELGRENEVHVFDYPRIGGSNEVVLDGTVWVHRFQNKGRRQMATTSQVNSVAEEIVRLKPNVCHIHGTGLYPFVMYRALKKRNLQIIVTVHGLVIVEKLNALKKQFTLKRLTQLIYQSWAEIRLLTKLPMAIVDTEYVKEKIKRYPIHNKPLMYVIPQGIDEDFFSICCSDKSKNVLSVGAIGERKGHLKTLKAYELLRQWGENSNLVIAGAVADKDYLKHLQIAIDESDYRDQISLYLNVSNESLKQLYKEARLFVLYTQEESQGIVYGEAMAIGLPIVTTRVGGVPYVVKEGMTGLLSEYGDIDAFASNIQNLLKDEARWDAMSKASIHRAQDYHWHAVTERIMELYQKIDQRLEKEH